MIRRFFSFYLGRIKRVRGDRGDREGILKRIDIRKDRFSRHRYRESRIIKGDYFRVNKRL
jgi:hypothetical protein